MMLCDARIKYPGQCGQLRIHFLAPLPAMARAILPDYQRHA